MRETATEMICEKHIVNDMSETLHGSSENIYGGQHRYLIYQDTIGALCQDDYKGPNRQYVDQGKLVICVR